MMIDYFLPISKKYKQQIKLFKDTVFFDASHVKKVAKLVFFSNPYYHFARFGLRDRIDPSPFFDSQYYLSSNPDVQANGLNPLFHYLRHGWKEGRSPSPLFNRSEYLASHPQIDPLKIDPAEDCLKRYGRFLGGTSYAIRKNYDAETIRKWSSFVDKDYYLSTYPELRGKGIDPVEHFIHYGHQEDRNANPWFDTFFYKQNYLADAAGEQDVVTHYAAIGLPTKLATHSKERIVLDDDDPDFSPAVATDLSICVHFHCFYPEQLGEFATYFSNLPVSSHIAITACSAADCQFIEKYLKKHLSKPNYTVRKVPNQGRDIAPFLTSCTDIILLYDLVLHIHTKTSTHINWGERWRKYLLDQVLGSPELVSKTIRVFAQNEDLGALYPENYHAIKQHTATNPNSANVEAVLHMLGTQSSTVEDLTEFPAGSFCWYRKGALKPFLDIFVSVDLFDTEEGKIDGTLAHALERVFPISIRSNGYQVRHYATSSRISPITILSSPQREHSSTKVSTLWPRDTPAAAARPPKTLEKLSAIYNPRGLDIHWVIPSFAKGAGGHMTIFRMVKFLENFGHRQTIWIQNAFNFTSEEQARDSIRNWYVVIGDRVQVLFLPDDMRQLSGDVIVATDAWTAFPVAQTTYFKERFYFIQDYEPLFHPRGANQLVAEQTYDLGFSALCAGEWLTNLMSERGLWARKWDLSVDQDIYFAGARDEKIDGKLKIAFYSRPYTDRRAVPLGFAAFAELKKRGVDFEVHLFGEENLQLDEDFPNEKHGILSHEELADLYRACDIGVVFSATNYSLIPLEMAACGLPVVEIDVPSTRAIFKKGEVTFAEPTPYGVADAVMELTKDPERLRQQRDNAKQFVEETSWEQSARDLEAAITERLASLGFKPRDPKSLNNPAISNRTKVSVVIPTYNAGPEFDKVLRAVTNQTCDFQYDVLVIDSTSTDQTPEIVKSFRDSRVRLEQIPQSEFQHGRTRNLGISLTDGDYVAIITQDALPKNDRWLSALISGFDLAPGVAGCFGRHQAYDHHGAFTIEEMKNHFDALAYLPNPMDLDVGLPSIYYPGSTTWRMLAYFYSDNNSAISRKAWSDLPYPEIEWGEDYVWSSLILKFGWQKAYADDAIVYHSHSFSPEKQFATAFTEGKFWAECFGIRLYEDEKAALNQQNASDRRFAKRHALTNKELQQRLESNKALISGRSAGWRSVT